MLCASISSLVCVFYLCGMLSFSSAIVCVLTSALRNLPVQWSFLFLSCFCISYEMSKDPKNKNYPAEDVQRSVWWSDIMWVRLSWDWYWWYWYCYWWSSAAADHSIALAMHTSPTHRDETLPNKVCYSRINIYFQICVPSGLWGVTLMNCSKFMKLHFTKVNVIIFSC